MMEFIETTCPHSKLRLLLTSNYNINNHETLVSYLEIDSYYNYTGC